MGDLVCSKRCRPGAPSTCEPTEPSEPTEADAKAILGIQQVCCGGHPTEQALRLALKWIGIPLPEEVEEEEQPAKRQMKISFMVQSRGGEATLHYPYNRAVQAQLNNWDIYKLRRLGWAASSQTSYHFSSLEHKMDFMGNLLTRSGWRTHPS